MAATATARRDTELMGHRGYWAVRFSGFALVGIIALLNPPNPADQASRTADVPCSTAARAGT